MADFRSGRSVSIAALSASLLTVSPAQATSLQQALAATYVDNPNLNGQRAQLKQADEQAAVARAEGRPQISATGSYTQGVNGLKVLDGYNRAIVAGATATVPLYQGGRVRNGIKAADTRVSGGRQDLRAAEGDTFVAAVTAYMDVLRDRAILAFDRENAQVLENDVVSSGKRLKGGDLTKTDVAQAQARLQASKSRVEAATAQLITSEQTFRQVTGLIPDVLDEPPPLPSLPISAEAAEDVALKNSPSLAAADAAVKAAGYDVGTARSARLPTLAATGGENYYSYRDRFGGIGDQNGSAAQAGVTLNVPLYQGGIVSARVRGARAVETQAMEQKISVERQVVATVQAAFAELLAANNTITESLAAVSANSLALHGVRVENAAGLRQVLDVLNAELELLNSKISLVAARHDAYVAGFRLLNAIGVADYQHLGIEGGSMYDPIANYRHAVRTYGDFADGQKPRATSKPIYGPIPVVDQPIAVGPD